MAVLIPNRDPLETMLHVRDGPDPLGSLRLENVFDKGQGVGIRGCALVQPAVVDNQSDLTVLLGDSESG